MLLFHAKDDLPEARFPVFDLFYALEKKKKARKRKSREYRSAKALTARGRISLTMLSIAEHRMRFL